MRRVVFNKKGGVGKTTIVCNLAAVSAGHGLRTLVVDLDPQCNSTRYLLGDTANDVTPTVADFFGQLLGFSLFPSPIETSVHPTIFDNLSVLPSHKDLDGLATKLESRYKIYKLREALEKLDFDRIYIDTPPALNFFTVSALIAAQRCLIPFDCDDFSRHALYGLMKHVREVQQDHNDALQVEGVVVNQFQARAKLPQRLIEELAMEGFPLLEPYLSASVKIRESHQESCPLIYLAPRHKLSVQFLALHDRLDVGQPVDAQSIPVEQPSPARHAVASNPP